MHKSLLLTACAFNLLTLHPAANAFDSVDKKFMQLAADVTGSKGASYHTRDSDGRQMASFSLLDSFASNYRYLALYHDPVRLGTHFRFDVHLAGSNDLKTWAHLRKLIHNADMPRIVRAWDRSHSRFVLAVLHEQWTGPPPESNTPSHLGVKLYKNEAALLAGEPFIEHVLPLSDFAIDRIEGTPNFHQAHIEIAKDGTIAFSSEIYFHYFSAKAGRDQQAHGSLIGMTSDSIGNWTAQPWKNLNRLMDRHGVKGNVGQRSVRWVGNNRRPAMFLEANIGGFTIKPGQNEWADWRLFYLRFPDENMTSGNDPEIKMVEPKTHQKSVSFGNPSWEIVRAPRRNQLAIVFNYFLFSEGTVDKSESESLVFYHLLEEPDFDEDGLDDLWEYHHTKGLSFFHMENRNEDFNADGVSALEESRQNASPFRTTGAAKRFAR